MKEIFTTFLHSFTYKKGSIVALSIPTSFGIEVFVRGESFFGISLGLVLVLSALITVDFITGLAAAKVKNIPVESKLLAKTFYKCLIIFLFFWVLFEVNLEVAANVKGDNEPISNFVYQNAGAFIAFIRTFMFILVTFREWISIGENSEKIVGQKYYIFSVTEKLFGVIERKFMTKIERELDDFGVINRTEEDKEETPRRRRR